LGSSASPSLPRQAGQCALFERLPQAKTVPHSTQVLVLVTAAKTPGEDSTLTVETRTCVVDPRDLDVVLGLGFETGPIGLVSILRTVARDGPIDNSSRVSARVDEGRLGEGLGPPTSSASTRGAVCSRREERRLPRSLTVPARIASRRAVRLSASSETLRVACTPLSTAGGRTRILTTSENRTTLANSPPVSKYRGLDCNSRGSGSISVLSALIIPSGVAAGNPNTRRLGPVCLLRPLKTNKSSSGSYDA